jgi:hypothetical protein
MCNQRLSPHLCLLCCLVLKQLSLPDGVVQLCVGVANFPLVHKQLKPLRQAGQVPVPKAREKDTVQGWQLHVLVIQAPHQDIYTTVQHHMCS